MQDLTIVKIVLAGKLDAELRAALNSKVIGVSTLGSSVVVHLDDSAQGSDLVTATNIVNAHDPTPIPDPTTVAVNTAVAQAGSTPIDGLTAAQAVAYINTNIVDLASAKAGLVVLVKYIGMQEARIRRLEKLAGL